MSNSAWIICPNCTARCSVLYDFRWCAACCPAPKSLCYRDWVWL